MIVLAAGALPLYAAQRYQADPMRQAVDLIKDRSTPDRANVLFDRVDTYERLAPFMPGWSSIAALQLGGTADAWSEQKVQSFSAEKPEVWYVLDFGADQKKDQRQAIDRKLSEALCKVSQEFAGSAQVSRFVNAQPDHDVEARHVFRERPATRSGAHQQHHLQGRRSDLPRIAVEHDTATANRLHACLCTCSIKTGRLVAQSDLQPGGGYAPTSSWPIGQPIADRHGVVLPPTLAPGDLSDRHRPVRAGWRAAHIEHGRRCDCAEYSHYPMKAGATWFV